MSFFLATFDHALHSLLMLSSIHAARKFHGCSGTLLAPLTYGYTVDIVVRMRTAELPTTPISDLSSIGRVTHVQAIGSHVEVWLVVDTHEGEQRLIRRIPCVSQQQAANIANLCKAAWS